MSYRHLEFLERIESAFDAQNSFDLKEISNDAGKIAVSSFDKSAAKIAVLAYSLSKMVSKEHIIKNTSWTEAKKHIFDLLHEASALLRKNKHDEFSKKLELLEKIVKKADQQMGNYVRNLWDKAKIKISSTAYAQGLSLSQAAELVDANKAELQNYIGITKIHDEEKTGYSMKQRMKVARAIFGAPA